MSHLPHTILGATALLLCSTVSAQDWMQAFPAAAPTARSGPALVYDTARSQTLLFGGALDGSTTGGLNDTWTWDGITWTQLTPATTPPTRTHAAASYDLARGVVVMFGGRIHSGPAGPTGVMNDLWEWDGTDWTLINATNPPPARYSATMAYDSARNVHVLFSGVNGTNFSFDDTWEYDPTTQAWTQVMPANSPGGRVYATMAYDLARQRIVVFGGADDAFVPMPDLFWEFDGTDWTGVATDSPPGEVQGHSMAFDVTRGRIVLQGGRDPNGFRIGTWEYDGVNCYQFNAESSPAGGNWLAAMTYDWSRSRSVVFGGYDANFSRANNTWERDPALPGFSVFGASCPTGSIEVGTVAAPALGAAYSVDVQNLPTGALAWMVAGLSNTGWNGVPLPRSLGPILGLPACTLYTSVDDIALLTNTGGGAAWSLTIPNSPAWAGVPFYTQALAIQGSTFLISNCAESTPQ